MTITLLMFSGCFYTKLDTNILNYREEKQDIPEYCMLLPPEITDEMEVKDYLYQVNYDMINGYGLFLKVEYSDENYQKEVDRLSGYKREYSWDGEKGEGYFLYDENCKYFKYPTYIAQFFGWESAFEYASIIGNNQIIYVYLECMEAEDVQIELDYLPLNYASLPVTCTDKQYCTYSDYITYRYYHQGVWDI